MVDARGFAEGRMMWGRPSFDSTIEDIYKTPRNRGPDETKTMGWHLVLLALLLMVVIASLSEGSRGDDAPGEDSGLLILRQTLGFNRSYASLDWSPDGDRLATTDAEGVVSVWDVDSWDPPKRISFLDNFADFTRWSPDGSLIAVALDDDSRFQVISTDDWGSTYYHGTPLTDVRDLSWHPDCTYLAVASQDGFRIYDTSTWTEVASNGTDVTTLGWSPDGDEFVTGGADGVVRRWDTGTWELSAHGDIEAGPIHSIEWSPSGERVAVACQERTMVVFDDEWMNDERLGTEGVVGSLAWLADGSLLAGASYDHPSATISIWNATDHSHHGTAHPVLWGSNVLDGDPTGTLLASIGEGNAVRIWTIDFDGDGVRNDLDDLPYDPAFSRDADGDRSPEEWNPGHSSTLLSYEDGLLVYHSFERDSPGFVFDGSGHGNNGLSSGVERTKKANSNAYQFNSQDAFIEVASDETLDISNELSIELWLDPAPTGRDMTVVEQTYDTVYGRWLLFRIAISKEGHLEMTLMMYDNETTLEVEDPPEGWFHIAGVVDGRRVFLYTNGAMARSSSMNFGVGQDIDGVVLRMGSSLGGDDGYEGMIDDVRLYNRTLSVDEVVEHFSGHAPSTVAPDLDAFPTDPSASVDDDGDGHPDEWNFRRSASDSTTGLTLDRFPADGAASQDFDMDGFPDGWNPGKDASDSTTGLLLDAFPFDLTIARDADGDGYPDGWLSNDLNGLVSYYPLDEETGDEVHDVVGVGNSGIAHGCDLGRDGAVDRGVVLDYRYDYIEFAQTVNLSGSYTVCFWLKLSSGMDTGLVLSLQSGDSSTSWYLDWYWGRLRYYMGSGPSGPYIDAHLGKDYVGKWMFVTIEHYQGYYHDGGWLGLSVDGTCLSNIRVSPTPNSSSASLYIGNNPENWDLPDPMKLSVDELFVFEPCMTRFGAYDVLMERRSEPVWTDDLPHDPAASLDTDGDGFPDEWNEGMTEANSTTGLHLDKFKWDPAASVDTDGDHRPDGWNEGMTEVDSTTPLRIDAFPNDWAAAVDSDGDGSPDEWIASRESTTGLHIDGFPTDPSASLDTDGDGYPDEWNPGMTGEDTTTNLTIDAFPLDAAASTDTDGDGAPGSWNEGKDEADSTTGLWLDHFPLDPAASNDTDGDGYPDAWNPGTSAGDSTTELRLDDLPTFSGASLDSDGDGYPDEWNDGWNASEDQEPHIDGFPDEPAAANDTDGDGCPDSLLPGWEWDQVDLVRDEFPDDPAAAIDSDGDRYPDRWNDGMTEADSTSGLELDAFPDDDSEWSDSDGDGIGDNSDVFNFGDDRTISIGIVVIILGILLTVGPMAKMRANLTYYNDSVLPLSILGSAGSGKTVFFAILSYVLGKGELSGMEIEYRKGLGYIKQIRTALSRGEWPDKTYVGEDIEFDARIFERKPIGTKVHNLSMHDIAGEDFRRALEPDDDSIELTDELKHVLSSVGHIWIIEPSMAEEDSWYFTNLVRKLTAILNLRPRDRFDVPVAVVFSQGDRYEELTDPEDYARRHLQELYPMLKRRFGENMVRFFKVSAIGKEENGRPKLPLEPTGVAELVEWLLERVRVPDLKRLGIDPKDFEPERVTLGEEPDDQEEEEEETEGPYEDDPWDDD